MRHLVFATAALFATTTLASAAEPYADPVALLTALYEGYAPTHEFPDQDAIDAMQSARLNGLFEKDIKEANGDIGRIDFDPYINGQDYTITKLKIDPPLYAGGKAIVHVTFDNFDTPQDLGYALVKEEGGWKIDDVWASSADYSYDLLDILQAPMP